MSAHLAKRHADARALGRLKKAVHDLTTWLRFMREVSGYRRVTFNDRARDLARARKLLAIAEARAATARRFSPSRR